MQAPLARRTLLSLVLGLLLLSTAAAMRGCPVTYQQLLSQLQRQADLTADTGSLLDPYILLQDLNPPMLRGSCKEPPGLFPSEDELQGLSRQGLLQTLKATLGGVLQGLAALNQALQPQDWKELPTARQSIQGIQNNVHCMSWLLTDPSEPAEPTRAGPGPLLQLTPAHSIFQAKLDGCRFLRGYHRFMGSVGRAFREWGVSPSRSRRQSPRRALRKGTHRTRPSRRGKGSVHRGAA